MAKTCSTKSCLVHPEPYTTSMNNKDITIASKDRDAALKITSKQAYEWVKTGVWNLKTFEICLDHVICEAEAEAKWGGCS